MPVEADMRYAAEVIAAQATESEQGTFGISVTFKTDAGNISRTIWITEKSLEYARKDLQTLGATDTQLESWDWLQDPRSLEGAQCSITTAERQNTKTGEKYVEVRWINPVRRKASPDSVRGAVALMRRPPGQPATQKRSTPDGPPLPDEDVPF